MPIATSEAAPTATSKQHIPAKKPITRPEAPQSKNVKVGVWNLRSTEFTEIEAPENTESLFSSSGDESVIGTDDRKKVSKKDLMPGGKYRSVVKLFLRFAGQDKNAPWAMGTGWLINNDTIVTAGHCSFDWSHNLGRLTHVKAYIGYAGKESIKDSTHFAVQFRTGKRVATTQGWLNGGKIEGRDVSFIQVNRPFTGIKPIKYQRTPSTGIQVVLGVVGYPGDLMNPKTKEKGAFMYEMYSSTTFDVSKTKEKMLQYRIDTYAGNSGSPVFRKSDMASIGVHVLGGNTNSASVISGPFGNAFDAHVAALKGKFAGSKGSADAVVDGKPASWLSWVTVPTKESISSSEPFESNGAGEGAQDEATADTEATIPSEQPEAETAAEEGLFDLFKKALQVSGPLGVIASIGLSAVGSVLKKKKEAAVDEAYSSEGVAERALLGEAALTTIINFGGPKCKQLGILDRMQSKVLQIQPICRRAGPAIMPFVMEPVWRATTGGLNMSAKQNGEADLGPSHIPSSDDINTLGFGPRLNANKEAILKVLTESLTMKDAEAFTDTETNIGDVIGKAIRVTGSTLSNVTESGLARLADNEADTEAGVETHSPEADINNPKTSEYTYDAMTQRAIAGEAALEALLQTPIETLQQEGWVDVFKTALTAGGKNLVPGFAVVSGAMGIAQAAINLATAKRNAKKKEMEAEAAQDEVDGAETGDTGETGDDGGAAGDGEAADGEAGVDGDGGVNGGAADGEAAFDDEAAVETTEMEFLNGLKNGV